MEQSNQRRWYDKDPVLKEALELLRLSTDDGHETAEEFINQLQEQVAQDVIERVYDMMAEFQGKGKRWYDNDPIMMKAIELLRMAPKKTQKEAALKLLTILEKDNLEALEKMEISK